MNRVFKRFFNRVMHKLSKGTRLHRFFQLRRHNEKLRRSRTELLALYSSIIEAPGITPEVFKVPILATLAFDLKIPIMSNTTGEMEPGALLNDYLEPIIQLLDKQGVLSVDKFKSAVLALNTPQDTPREKIHAVNGRTRRAKK